MPRVATRSPRRTDKMASSTARRGAQTVLVWNRSVALLCYGWRIPAREQLAASQMLDVRDETIASDPRIQIRPPRRSTTKGVVIALTQTYFAATPSS